MPELKIHRPTVPEYIELGDVADGYRDYAIVRTADGSVVVLDGDKYFERSGTIAGLEKLLTWAADAEGEIDLREEWFGEWHKERRHLIVTLECGDRIGTTRAKMALLRTALNRLTPCADSVAGVPEGWGA